MAKKLGSVFSHSANGPLNFAGKLIMARKVDEALPQLTEESLWGAVNLGIRQAAAQAGVSSTFVAGLLPLERLQVLVKHIGQSHQRSAHAWKLHTGHIGGLLDGVADLTIDGRPPDVTLCLHRLARKMFRDKSLREPLAELAEQLEEWVLLLGECQQVLNDSSGQLAHAYRMHRLRRTAALAAAVLVVGIIAALIARSWAAKARLDEVLGLSDPCTVEKIDPDDLAHASDEQEQRIAGKHKACEDLRAEQRRIEEEKRRKEEERRLAEERRKKRLAQCRTLVDAVSRQAERVESDHPGAGLVKRIIAGKLEPEDVSLAPDALPCSDAPGAEQIRLAFARAVLRSTDSWMGHKNLSQAIYQLIVKRRDEISDELKRSFINKAEVFAESAARKGDDGLIAEAARLCGLKNELFDFPDRRYCQMVVYLANKK